MLNSDIKYYLGLLYIKLGLTYCIKEHMQTLTSIQRRSCFRKYHTCCQSFYTTFKSNCNIPKKCISSYDFKF